MSRVEAAEAYLDGCNRGNEALTLREVREKRGLTLRQVEEQTGFNRGTLSRIERGIEVPTPLHLLALSDLYGVPPGEWRVVLEYRIPEEAMTT